MTGLVIVHFAGGGGSSKGIAVALGRDPDVAINHDGTAMAVHEANFPHAEHYTRDVYEVDPLQATRGRPVGLLWASPDCTHFSRAKGARPKRPRSKKIRALAWVMRRWAAEVRPAVLILENVEEFTSWGPLDRRREPIAERKAETFRAYVSAFRRLGYVVEWRVLDASTFGAPTRRKRLFLVARCDGGPIRWPAPTHGPGLLPLRTSGEFIDWSIPCPSIFERRRRLAANTERRLAQGIQRFVIESPRPYFVPAGVGIATKPMLFPEIKAQRRAAFLSTYFGGMVGDPLDKPMRTITARDHNALVVANLVVLRNHVDAASLDEPAPTIVAGGLHLGECRALLTKFYSSPHERGADLFDPAPTITSKARFGLVLVEGTPYRLADVGMRMLRPHELLGMQFGEYADGYDLSAATTQEAQIRLIGNSVCPHVAAAVVRANLSPAAAELVA